MKAPSSSVVRQIDILTTSPRVEVKIPVPATLGAEVDAWVRLHPIHWRRTYPARTVNNLYFDTADYAGLNANLAGIAERAKMRLRWYGPSRAYAEAPRLELKRKQGSSGWKEIVPLHASFDLSAVSWVAFERELNIALDGHAGDWLARFPVPVLINTYGRAYYATPDDEVRLTVDTGLASYDQRASSRPNLSRQASMQDVVVIELKAPASPRSMQRLSAAVASLPARADRFSKYVRGVMAAPDL